jgi:translation initiation factor 5A
MEFSDIKKGVVMMVKDQPCKIMEVNTSRPGKHGHAKKTVTAIQLITNKKYVTTFTHHSNLEIPEINRNVYICYSLDDNYAQMMNDDGENTDILLTNEQVKELQKYDLDNGVQLEVMSVSCNDNDETVIVSINQLK